ncbi:MFS transporter [Schaalia vaccimaxillae]|uniref:MFS transporter n=1 Tax=Schaalia vaccimaxillae TaxID=183916 RepID=UPI0004226D9C|nr:MFS transporter [Schaalia vaccimaxillae]
MSRSPILAHPTLRALLAIALFTYTAQNMLNVSIGPLARALELKEWIVGAAVSLAAVAVTLLSQFWGRRSISWGRRKVLLWALVLAFIAGSLFSAAVGLRAAGMLGAVGAGAAVMLARGPFFGSAVAAIPPTGQALVAEVTPDEESRVKGMSAFSGAINLSIMIGSLVSSALGSWWIYGPVHATPWFIVIALIIAAIWIPRDGELQVRSIQPLAHSTKVSTGSPAITDDSTGNESQDAPLPPKVSWRDQRLLPWICGIFGFFFASGVLQITAGFLVQDRGGLTPEQAVSPTALMLLATAAGAMLMQLVVVPRLGWKPLRLLRAGMTIGVGALTLLTFSHSLTFMAIAAFSMGIANGLASPGFTAGASLAVTPAEQGGVAGVVNSTGAVTWIFAPVTATALYGWQPLSPLLLALALLVLSCSISWFHPGLRRIGRKPADTLAQ